MNTVETLDSPFKHLVMTIGELPTTFVESMSYYETIAWLVDYIRKNIIPSINNNAEAIKEIQDWIKTLDLQDEVDNKLEEMAESGELTEIIAQYLQLGAVIAFNTLSDMVGSENLADGSTCRILGKTDYKDGDGSYYKIRELINTDVIDGDNLVALTNYPTLVAEKVPHGFIGDLADLTTSDKDNVVDAINEVNSKTFKGLQYHNTIVYIDGTNGDDDNDGLTYEHPKKTITNAIESYANKEFCADLFLELTAGSYEMDFMRITDVSIHMYHNSHDTAESGTININMQNTDSTADLAIYSAHINIKGTSIFPFNITFIGGQGTGIYFDNCQAVFEYCTFNNWIRAYSGHFEFTHCTLYSLNGRGANFILAQSRIGYLFMYSSKAQLYQCTLMTEVNSSTYWSWEINNLFTIVNSDLLIFGVTNVHYNGIPSVPNFLYSNGSRLSITSNLIVESGSSLAPFSGDLKIENSILIATQTRYNYFKQNATNVSVDAQSIVSPGLTL